MICVWRLLLLVTLCGVTFADITGTNPPEGTCLCFTHSGVRLRNPPCGTIIGSAGPGVCYRYRGNKVTCTIGSTPYEFFHLDYNGQDAWSAGNYLAVGNPDQCGPAGFPETEFRSLWIATASNIDWPSSRGLPTVTAQEELLRYLDIMRDLNMNAVILQIRPVGDAFYSSTLEPWSVYLTGTQGLAPSPFWDPVSFTITEARRRNIEVHVWLNPYRANLRPNWDGLAPNHMANRFRQHAKVYGNFLWMDPGASAVQDHLVDVIMDIINRYDVDGVHFDDYFYPYPVRGVDFPDDDTYGEYLAGGGTMNRADWRRDNVNRMVSRVYNAIKLRKRSVKFSISPFGIYRPGHPEGMPPPIRGLDQYSALYADPKLWLEQGWLDYIAPQLYWAIAPPGQSYPLLLDWWLNNNPQGRHVYVGNALYRIRTNNWPVSEITNQIAISRQWASRLSLGNIQFSAKYFRDNDKGVFDIFRSSVYPNIARVPPMAWLQEGDVPKPASLKINGKKVTWDSAPSPLVHQWAVYRRDGDLWVLLKLLPGEETSISLSSGCYAIRGVSRVSMESEPVIITIPDGTITGWA